MLRRVVLLTAISAISLTACGKKKVAPITTGQTPTPVTVSTRDTAAERLAAEAAARMRADSIANARAASDAAERATRMAAVRASLEQVIYFDYNEDKLRTDAEEVLGQKAQILRANADVKMRIAGHTDERGSVEYNMALGMRRAQVVRDYLVGFGIAENRLEIVSMGEDQPQDPGHDESAWSRNRRAAFSITGGAINAGGQ